VVAHNVRPSSRVAQAGGVVVAVQPGDGQEVRHLPQEHDAEEQPGFLREGVGGGGPADDRRQRARYGAYDGGERGAQLERRVEPDVDDQRGERHEGREQVHAECQQQEAHGREHEAEHARLERLDAPIGQGPQPRALHQAIHPPLVDLVERGGAAGDQRRAEHGQREPQVIDGGERAQVVADRGGRHHQDVQPRLGERHEIARAAVRDGERHRLTLHTMSSRALIVPRTERIPARSPLARLSRRAAGCRAPRARPRSRTSPRARPR
jgi:hypothetical protein